MTGEIKLASPTTDLDSLNKRKETFKATLWQNSIGAILVLVIITLALLLATKKGIESPSGYINTRMVDTSNTSSSQLGTPSIVFLGDSNTKFSSQPEIMGFQTMFVRDYVRKADVLNRGISGWTTRKWRNVFASLLSDLKTRPVLLTMIILGTNDACLTSGEFSFQNVPLDEYKTLLESFVRDLRSIGHHNILLGTPFPFDDTSSYKTTRSNAAMKAYATAVLDVGKSSNVSVLDLWTPLQPDIPTIFYDGVHLSRQGNIAAYTLIKKKIQDDFPHLVPQALPYIYQ